MLSQHRSTRRAPRAFIALLLPLFLTAACDDDEDNGNGGGAEPTLNIVEIAAGTPELSTLVTAVTAAELGATLQGPGPFTVFAPVNSAFADLDPEVVARLLEEGNQALLQKVLTYHVVPGRIYAADLVDGARVRTVQGDSLTIDLTGGATVNGVNIVAADIEATNGVIHLIDAVMLENLDLVDVAIVNGFDALVGAATAAGLVDELRSPGPLTVFAPTDEAFAALGAAAPTDPAVLANVLLYHVVSGRALSTGLSDGQMLTTLQGGSLTIDLGGGVTILGDSSSGEVVAADVRAKNGVIHVVDAVLLP